MGGDEIELVARFISIYKDDLLPEQPAPDLGDITAEDVEYSIDHGGNSAGGADLWKPRELKWFGKVFWVWVLINITGLINGEEDQSRVRLYFFSIKAIEFIQ